MTTRDDGGRTRRARVIGDLARGRAPKGDALTVQGAVDRLDRMVVGVFVALCVAVLLLVVDLLSLRSTHPDRWGAAAAGLLLVVALLVAVVRRRALATARRLGHHPSGAEG